ncbi:hypothetical protein [Claveliimonas bilis]|uniref:LAGLIDADG homing endonuclease n=1 Tax=Claveliimonas bilis TaxID=3028070 RepID=A0ABM8ID35_9FIRM|nr:hypothetical protein [Claveliimonas bilis]BDZ78238.1 hypothetical protein Lac1_24210 [Claveliimonas bilis]
MNLNFQTIIDMFIAGETSGRAGSKTAPGNLSIHGNQLMHYSTPIMERTEKGFIVNLSQYSIQTGRVQKMLKETLKNKHYYWVLKVPRDYKGSLSGFQLNEEGDQ